MMIKIQHRALKARNTLAQGNALGLSHFWLSANIVERKIINIIKNKTTLVARSK